MLILLDLQTDKSYPQSCAVLRPGAVIKLPPGDVSISGSGSLLFYQRLSEILY